MLYKKGISYNSERAIKLTEELFRYLTLRSMKCSIELAKKYGSYDAFNIDLFFKANERFFKHKTCREINIEHLIEDIKKYGIRNSCFTSIAPTGTISTIANTSGGIEPVFALTYIRKVEKMNKEYDLMFITDPVFDKYLSDNFKEEKKQQILKEVSENKGSCQKCKDIPKEMRDIFVVAGDLTPTEHLDILEKVANNVSLSVSKTINMPNEITRDKIADVFLNAHDRGVIGVTCYRDGCRDGILVHDIEQRLGTIIKENHAPKRPKKLPCEIHRVVYQNKKWIVFVGILDDKPFEIFAGAIEDVNIPKNIDNGFIIKEKSKHYSFEFEDEILINNIRKSFDVKEHDAFARLISLALRHGTPIVYVVDVLNKAEGDITSFAKVISRTLKKYIKNGERAGICPECGSKMIYYEGCTKCSTCSFTKCG
jgi:ribonucleoside-diphosphate reductase alpha chain